MISFNIRSIAVISLCALSAACGGGGGGGSGPAGISYTGSTSPAVLTATSSGGMLNNAYSGGNSGAVIGGVTAGLNGSGGQIQPRSRILSQSLLRFSDQVVNRMPAAHGASATVTTLPADSVAGTCGGSATVSGSYDDASGGLTLNTTFSNYCEESTTLNGAVTFSGHALQDAQNNINVSDLSITLSNLTVSYPGDSFTADGTLAIAPQQGFSFIDSNVILTMAMLLKDNTTQKVYKMESYQESVSDSSTYYDISIAGRFYDPDEGYIDLSTPTAFRISVGDEWPSSGVFKAVGDHSSASLTALNNASYQLDVDTDNDGVTDFTATGLWGSL